MRGSWQLKLAYLEDLVRGNGRMRIGDEVTGGHGSSATTSERSRLRTQYQYSQSGGKTLLRPPGSTRFHRYCSMRQHNKKDHVSKNVKVLCLCRQYPCLHLSFKPSYPRCQTFRSFVWSPSPSPLASLTTSSTLASAWDQKLVASLRSVLVGDSAHVDTSPKRVGNAVAPDGGQMYRFHSLCCDGRF